MRALVAGPLLVAAAALGCAQPGTPPGGEVDRTPPRVVEVVPLAFDTITDLDEPVVIRFNERISERLEGVRNWEEAVIVSPATSPVEVDAGRRGLEISLVQEWEPDRVYTVMVRPVFRDLFNNPRVDPIEFVFSTGAPIEEGALAGFVTDQLTGQAVTDVRVEAIRRGDSTRFVTQTDTAGFFAMRFMPAGAYSMRAWQDQNRDRAVDFFEMQDTARTRLQAADTAVLELTLLQPDTTPARLARAEALDSARVALHFDDHFAPGPVDGRALIHTLPDTLLVGEGTLFHASRLDSLRAAEAEKAAAREADEVEPPEEAEPGEPADPAEPGEPAAEPQDVQPQDVQPRRASRTEGAPLPSQQLILSAPDLLEADSAYYVRVEGLTNIQGVRGGGGAARFIMPPRPEPEEALPPEPEETVPPDTLSPDVLPPDVLPPDTVSPDTVPPRGRGPG